MKTTFYTYVYIDPRNGLPFYVGKGKKDRKYSHLKKAKKHIVSNGNGYLYRQIKEILNEGLEPIIRTVYNGSEDFAFIIEKKLVKNFRKIGINLHNLTDGGEGKSGYNCSTETKLKMSKSHMGNKGFTQKHTKETKLKIGKANSGRIQSEKEKNIRSVSMKGKIPKNLNVIQQNRKRAVIQCNNDGNVVNEFDSISSAFLHTSINCIWASCNGRYKQAGGYIWKYKE